MVTKNEFKEFLEEELKDPELRSAIKTAWINFSSQQNKEEKREE